MGVNPTAMSSSGGAQQTFTARKDSDDGLDVLPRGGSGVAAVAVGWTAWGGSDAVARQSNGADFQHEADLRRVGTLLCALSVIGMLTILGWITFALI